MNRAIPTVAGGVDAQAFVRSEHRRDREWGSGVWVGVHGVFLPGEWWGIRVRDPASDRHTSTISAPRQARVIRSPPEMKRRDYV